jgi:hypothetical protein
VRGRQTLVDPVLPERPKITAVHVLIGMVVFWLFLVAIAVLLTESGWRHPSPSPAPMVTDVQLPDVAGDGS